MPTLFDRISFALKSFRFPTNDPANLVTIYPNWASFDAAIDRLLIGNTGTKRDYAQLVGDLTQSSLIMAAIRCLGNAASEPDLEVRRTVNNQDDDELVNDHPLVELWDHPNPFMTSSTLMKGIAASWILADNAYILKVRNKGGQVIELWYESHQTIMAIYPKDGSKFITNYQIDRGSDKIDIPIEDVIHFRNGLDPANPRYGLAAMPAILREIFGDNESANYYANLMEKGAVPPYFISVDNKAGELGKEDLQNIQTGLVASTQGDNRGKPGIITNAKAEKLAWSPSDMDIRLQRYFAEERFSAVTGINGHVMNLGSAAEHSIYNNVTEAGSSFAEDYLVPFWKHIEEELTRQLLPDFSKDSQLYVHYCTERVKALQENENEKHARVAADFQAGVITRAEAKRAIGLDADDTVDNVYYKGKGGELVPADFVTPDPVPLPDPNANPAPAFGQNGNGLAKQPVPAKGVHHLSSMAERQKIREHWERHAPERIKGLISAKAR